MRLIGIVACIALPAALLGEASAQSDGLTEQPYVISASVALIEEAQVPAEEAGVLESLEVREGFRVKARQLLAQIADDRPQKQKQLAEKELEVARLQAENDVDIRFAKESERLAKVDLEEAEYARELVAQSLSNFELRRRSFSWERSKYAIEQAQRDRQVASVNAEVAEARLAIAENEISRRRVEARFAGVVSETYLHVGEWVNPGDPILRLVRMDRLKVEGFVKAEDFAPHEIFGQPVTIDVQLARNRMERFQGRIGFVSPEIGTNGFRVSAEIENRPSREGFYLVQPGQQANMTLNVKRLAANVPSQQTIVRSGTRP